MNRDFYSTINLLFLIYDLERGGPELRLLDLQRYLPAHFGINICVTSKNLALLPQFLKANARIMILPVKRAYLEMHKARLIYRIIRNQNIHVINAFALKELILALSVKFLTTKKLYIVYHAVETFEHLASIQKLTLNLLLKFVNCVLCNSEDLKLKLGKLSVPEKKIRIINNGIDTDFFDRIQYMKKGVTSDNLNQKDFIIGTIANFRKEKNYPFLIKTFSILLQNYSNLKLLCVGGGSLLQEMKSLAKTLDLEKKVVFTGSSSDIRKHLYKMDLFVLCSQREGFPNVLLQAMSMSIPVLSADVGGCAEIIEHGKNGMLYPSGSINKFVNSMKILLEDAVFAAEIAKNGRKTVVNKFSLNRMIVDYGTFYKELTSQFRF